MPKFSYKYHTISSPTPTTFLSLSLSFSYFGPLSLPS